MSPAIAIPNSVELFHFPPRQNEVVFAVNLSLMASPSHGEVIKLISKFDRLSPKFEYRLCNEQLELWLVLWRGIIGEPLPFDFLMDEFSEISHVVQPDIAVVFAGRFPGGFRKLEAAA